MATLEIKNIPDELYRRLQELADAQHLSINAFAIAILEAELSTKTKALSGQPKQSVK
jgi:plasmid stability protein